MKGNKPFRWNDLPKNSHHSSILRRNVIDILFKLTLLDFEGEYDEKKDNLRSYLKGRHNAFKDVLIGEQSKVRGVNT